MKFSGEVTEVRLNPETHVRGYAGGSTAGSVSSWISQVGAITVRIGGKPVTCLIDMQTRNIGIMPGNNVTIWGRARVWKAGSNLPESVDVKRLACDETGEIHPSGRGASGAALLIPVFFCIFFGFIVIFLFVGPMSFMGGSSFLAPLLIVPGFFMIFIMIVFVAIFARGRGTSVGDLEQYVEVGSLTSISAASGSAGKCIVCNLAISKADEVVFCPHCGSPAHREHMLEWLHTHDYCPVCEKHLDEHYVEGI